MAFKNIFPENNLQYVDVPGGKIAVESSGTTASLKKGTILCLPGMGDLRQQYRFLAPALEQAGYKVLVSDLRGHGQSSATFSSYTQLDAAQDAQAIMDFGSPSEPVILVGNSMSGASIIQVAGSMPGRVKAIIGLGPIPFDQSVDKYFRPTSHLLFAWPWGVSMWVAYWSGLFLGGKPADMAEYSKALKRNLNEPGRMAALGQLVRSPKEPCWAVAKDVKCPALMLLGSKDPDYPSVEAAAEKIRAGLSSSRALKVEVLEGLGHYPHVERPEEVSSKILDFLAGV